MKAAIVIGRFQPLHLGHLSLLEKAKEVADVVFVLIGSANRAPSIKNPFTYEERKEKIKQYMECVTIPLDDYLYDNKKWTKQVNDHITTIGRAFTEVVMVGHSKEGNDYLGWFPNVPYIEADSEFKLTATEVREQMFTYHDQRLAHVQDDWNYFQREKEVFGAYPYPDTLNFVCADNLLLWNGHILLIKRKNAPGKGLWALPGGFKNNNETLKQAADRELKEETGIVLTPAQFGFAASKLYDDPRRSFGIPRLTMVYAYVAIGRECPEVVAQDDACDIQWVPLANIGKGEFMLFDDHQDIIFDLVGEF